MHDGLIRPYPAGFIWDRHASSDLPRGPWASSKESCAYVAAPGGKHQWPLCTISSVPWFHQCICTYIHIHIHINNQHWIDGPNGDIFTVWPCLRKGCLYHFLSWSHLSHGPVPRGWSGCCWNLIRCNAWQRSRRAVVLMLSDLVDFHIFEGVYYQWLRKVLQKPRCQNLPNDSEKSVLVNSSADPLCAVTGENYIEFPGWNRSHQELSRTYFPIPTLLFVVPPLRCRPLRSRRCSTNGSGANQWCRCDSWLNDEYDEPLLLISSSWMFMRCFEAGKGWLLRSLWIVHLALGDLDVHSSAVQLGDSWAHTIFRFVQKRKIGFTASAKHN